MKKGQFGRGAALWGLFVLLGGGLAQAAADGRAPELKIAVSPSVALYGTPFFLKVTGLRPGERAAIKAVSTDARKILWESTAVFEADAAGAVDADHQAPVSGAYGEADIFGLLWSMKPVNSNTQKRIGCRDDEVSGWTVDFSVSDSAGATASTRFRCVYQSNR